MMFYMNSKVFEKFFLDIEDDDDILDAQYVIVSTRIRVSDRECDNIINAKSDLFPELDVCSALDEDTFRERYLKQLSKSKALIAYLIKGSIEEKFNIIFMCSKNEDKIGYLKYLAEFCLMEFGYPVYEYKRFCQNLTADIHVNEKKVLHCVNEVLNKAKEDAVFKMKDEEVVKDIKSLSKKQLKKQLKKLGLYEDGMDKYTMRDLLEYELL